MSIPPWLLRNTCIQSGATIGGHANRLRALFVLAVHTGMRRGGLFKLEWQGIDFSKGTRGFI